MDFFGQRIAFGLFDSERDAENAVRRLNDAGFGGNDSEEDVTLVDRHRLTAAVPAKPAGAGSLEVAGRRVPANLMGVSPTVDRNGAPLTLKRAAMDFLSPKGLGDAETGFLAERIDRGAILILVECRNASRAAGAGLVLERANATAAAL